MNILEIIDKKVEKKELTRDEIYYFIENYTNDKIPDYQASALLMSIVLNGMSTNETYYLTKAILNSGKTINWGSINESIVDKHSTGGIGDKVTLIILPIVASLNQKIAMACGPGLGYTGGTSDKLESIDGFSLKLSEKKFINIVKKIGGSIMVQTNDFTPADKKIYALRDVTSTINSIPLICSSIVSKKIATNANFILIDIKCGNGAAMKTIVEARALSKALINIGRKFKKNIYTIITNMSTPLGRTIGNKIEVLEAIDVLKGKGEKNLNEISIKISALLLIYGKKYRNYDLARKAVIDSIQSGKALKKFNEFIKTQNGSLTHLYSKKYWNPKYKHKIYSNKAGYMKITSALLFGKAAINLGAGRISKNDVIDYDAGIYINKKTGEKVQKNDLIFTLYSSKKINSNVIKEIESAYEITNVKKEIKIIIEE